MLEPEIVEFIAATSAVYPADAVLLPVAQQRQHYDHLSATLTSSALPAGVRAEDALFTAEAGHKIALRAYRRGDTTDTTGVVLYFHGGGFVLGSLESHQFITARLAADTGLCIVAVAYRLAPEHPAPAAHEDCVEITLAALDGRLSLVPPLHASLQLAGDSAGGTLAASVALQLRDLGYGGVQGLALIYPMLGAEPQLPARESEAHAPLLTLADVYAFRRYYWGDTWPPAWATPLDTTDLSNLPATLAIGVEHDPLRDDALVFAQRIQAAGGQAEAWLGEGLVHGCWRALQTSPGVQRLHGNVCRFLREIDVAARSPAAVMAVPQHENLAAHAPSAAT
ncbi:alpha/beta hydrolase [Paraburkholderia bonniea]|uniref:alpha/beta hydrolase n=1 Tax=Paraburkholderia bonniea TaxID=2152891 RepID=UPI002574548E|nr:alpha/beta hydrolase [Paraburkholderia bonniea]WJF91493.1 alpha/beta hydrolase [Paraburkholderia bonniea]WJF94811.1 alpha/beta hydrolase [Paraburkholderia bonniea]